MPNSQFSIPLNHFPIGIAGAARSGKDTLCRGIIRQLKEHKIDAIRKSIAGDSVKTDLKDFLLEKFYIDSFTENSEQKEFIRPLLVEYGKMQRNKTKGRYFIDAFIPTLNVVNILPDIRYMEYPEDEVYWLKNEVKGLLIFIKRKGIQDANDTERVNNKIISGMADYILEWDTLKEKNPEDVLQIDCYAKLIVDQYYIPILYSATTCQ
jgi:hypothetical protein